MRRDTQDGALTEALRALWAVRVLDAWTDHTGLRAPSPERVSQAGPNAWHVATQPGKGLTRRHYHGATPDAARLAAAEAVFPDLPEGVRAKLGEQP